MPMPPVNYTIQDVHKTTGLSIPILRKYIKRLKPILEKFITRGNNNTLLFDTGGMSIFDQIKQYREQDLTLPQIEKRLKTVLETFNQNSTNVHQTTKQSGQTDNNVDLVNKLIEAHQEIAKEKEKRHQLMCQKDERIIDLEKANEALRRELLLLPEGKTPSQMREAWDDVQKKQLRVKDLRNKLGVKNEKLRENNGIWIWQISKRKKIMDEIEKLTHELDKLT